MTDDLQPKVELGADVVVPASWVRPFDRCMHDRGFVATEVHQGTSGTNEEFGYTWTTPTYFVWKGPAGREAMQTAMACRQQFSPYAALSDEDVAAVYERWTKERLCLMDFGYGVPEPPTLEEFTRTWDTGPWTPVDQIRQPTQAAMDACGLEMLR